MRLVPASFHFMPAKLLVCFVQPLNQHRDLVRQEDNALLLARSRRLRHLDHIVIRLNYNLSRSSFHKWRRLLPFQKPLQQRFADKLLVS